MCPSPGLGHSSGIPVDPPPPLVEFDALSPSEDTISTYEDDTPGSVL